MPRRFLCGFKRIFRPVLLCTILVSCSQAQVIEPFAYEEFEWLTNGPSTSFMDPANWDSNTVPDRPDPDPDDDGVAAVIRNGIAGGNQATINDGDVVSPDYLHVWTNSGDAGALNILGGELNVQVEMRVETEVDGCCWLPDDRDTATVVNQSGGAVTVGTNFHLGRDNHVPAKGIYNMSGGTLDIGGAYYSGDAAAGEDAENASGIMNISGGTMTVHSDWSGTDANGEIVENEVSTSSIRAQFNLSGNGTAIFANPDATVQVGQGNAGDGRVHIQDNGSLTVNGTMSIGQQQSNGDLNKSEVIIESGTATLANVQVGGWGADGLEPELGRSLAYFNLSGGTATATGMQIGAHYNTHGELNVSGGSLQVTGATSLGTDPNGVEGSVGVGNISGGTFQTGSMELGVLGEGTVNQTGGTLTVDTTITLGAGNQGVYNLSGGVLDMSGGDIGLGESDGAFNFDGGTLLDAGNVDIDLVNNGGTLAPGSDDAGGTTNVSGDYLIVNADAALNIELGGSADGEFDKLVVGGSVLLDGSLNVSLMNGFSPASGSSFDILDFAVLDGVFSSVNLPTLAGGLSWDQSELLTTGVLSVVGEGGPLMGDFNEDGTLDAADIDALTAVVIAGSNDAAFDVNGDTVVDQLDRTVWVQDLSGTWFGDSNLDGEFNSSDLVQVFAAGEYEDATAGNSTWATGDWNGDGDFTSSDLVTAFGDGGFEQGPRTAIASVPEPSSALLAMCATTLLAMLYRRRLTKR